MSAEKSNIKIETAHELGCRLDDSLEASQRDLLKIEGSIMGLRASLALIAERLLQIDKDVDDKKLTKEESVNYRKCLEEIHGTVKNQVINSENNRFFQVGRISSLELAVAITKSFCEEEAKKVHRTESPVPVKQKRSKR